MKIKQIAKSVIRGFTLSAVMTSMTVNTFAASSSITDAKPLIIATYGIFNEDSNSAENVLNANPGTTDSIDFDSTMQEEFSPRNFTANQTGNAQLFTSASWENEANGTAKIETTFKIDDLNSKSGERAVYISATCTSHGNNLFLTAENITKLCQNYKHVDVIMVGPRRTTDVSEKMIKGTWNCFTKSDPAGVFGVVYDIQDKINEDSTERYTYDGKTYDIARGFLKKDHSGYSSIVKTQNTINNGKGVLFRDRKSVVKNISTANRFLTFTGDRHAQGYEYIAISAYLNNKWGFGSRSLNDISCMYVYVDTGGWMGGDSDAYEQTGWKPKAGAYNKLTYSYYDGGVGGNIWPQLATLRREGRYKSFGGTKDTTETAYINGESTNVLPLEGKTEKQMRKKGSWGPNNMGSWSEFQNMIIGLCNPLDWTDNLGENYSNAYLRWANGAWDISGWYVSKKGYISSRTSGDAWQMSKTDITNAFGCCQLLSDLKNGQYKNQKLFQGSLFMANNGAMVEKFWSSTSASKKSYITYVTLTGVGSNSGHVEKKRVYKNQTEYGTYIYTVTKLTKITAAIASNMGCSGKYKKYYYCLSCGRGGTTKKANKVTVDKTTEYHCPYCNANIGTKNLPSAKGLIMNGYFYNVSVANLERGIATKSNGTFSGIKMGKWGSSSSKGIVGWFKKNVLQRTATYNYNGKTYYMITRDGTNSYGEKRLKTNGTESHYEYSNLYYPDYQYNIQIEDQDLSDAIVQYTLNTDSYQVIESSGGSYDIKTHMDGTSKFYNNCPGLMPLKLTNAGKYENINFKTPHNQLLDCSDSAPVDFDVLTLHDNEAGIINLSVSHENRSKIKGRWISVDFTLHSTLDGTETDKSELKVFDNVKMQYMNTSSKAVSVESDSPILYKRTNNSDSNYYSNQFHIGKVNGKVGTTEDIKGEHSDNYSFDGSDYVNAKLKTFSNGIMSLTETDESSPFEILYHYVLSAKPTAKVTALVPPVSGLTKSPINQLIKRGSNYNIFSGSSTTNFRGWNYYKTNYVNKSSSDTEDGNSFQLTGDFMGGDTFHYWMPFNRANNCVLVTFDTNRFEAEAAYNNGNSFTTHLNPGSQISYTGNTSKSTFKSVTGENTSNFFIQRYYSTYGTVDVSPSEVSGNGTSGSSEKLVGTMGVWAPNGYFTGTDGKKYGVDDPIAYWDIVSSQRDLTYGDWDGNVSTQDAFPTVTAPGTSFIGWNSKPDGTGSWFSATGTGTVTFDGKTYNCKELIVKDIDKTDDDWQSGLFCDSDGKGTDYAGQSYTLYAIYSDNTEVSDYAYGRLPDLDPATGITFTSSGVGTVTYTNKTWTADKYIENSPAYEEYQNNQAITDTVKKNKGKKNATTGKPINGNTEGWTNASEGVTVQITGRDKATGVFKMVSQVKSWNRTLMGTVTSYMGGRTSLTAVTEADYTWDTVGSTAKAINTRLDGSTDLSKGGLATLKAATSKYSSNYVNYNIAFKIQGTYFLGSSAQSRQYDDAWSNGTGVYPATSIKHGMAAYDDSNRRVINDSTDGKTTADVGYSEASADVNDHVVIKLDFTPPKIHEDTARVKRGKIEFESWGDPLEWGDVEPKIEGDDGLYTSFLVQADDYNDISYGQFYSDEDSAGIQGVYVLVRDPDEPTNQKIYKLSLLSSKPYVYTTNPDLNILSAWYGLALNLYTEFPTADRLVYQIFAVDNAGNTDANIGGELDPDNPEHNLVDPDPPDGPAPEKSPKKGKFDNFSMKAILMSDESDTFNIDVEAGDVYFRAGDLGHFNVATVGYAGLGVDQKTQNGKDAALELDFYSTTPSWAKSDYGINWTKEIGQEAYEEIHEALIPIKYNLGIVGDSGRYSDKHWIRRLINYSCEGARMVYPEQFSYYQYNSDTDEGEIIIVTDRNSSEYKSRLYHDGVPYAVVWSWTVDNEDDFGRDYGDIDDNEECWEDDGTRVRIPPYYVMQSPVTGYDEDGNEIHEPEVHPWTVYSYKNDAYRDINNKYVIYDTWRNELHYRVIHEDASDKYK